MSAVSPVSTSARERQKRRAAAHAVSLVEAGMVVGLGAGTTAAYALPILAERVRMGELRDVIGVPCSAAVGASAESLGLRVVTLTERPRIDLTIDGADEVDPELGLIKGRGGALLHEKMVAQASQREVIVVDEGKLSPRLGTRALVPVEVLAFGWRAEEGYLRELGGNPVLRMTGSDPFSTDEGNLVLDCRFGPLDDPRSVAGLLDARAGIAGHGLFIGLATEVLVGGDTAVRHLSRSGEAT